ncbi:MAG: ABC transporter substrate-binding protein [Desulfobacterales bacterium]|nr:ABC transporter substrate-binding protein [Desulfobacterales bacterium]MBF0398680.1 ABC transporter substrate-binding protein [Desulfobacterales bacterium]
MIFIINTIFINNIYGEPILKIGYSDWPGWIAWEIGIQKNWFKEENVEASFFWYSAYAESLDAFASGKVDAVCMTNCDALVLGANGKHSKGILINDFSNGNDMIIAKPGITKIIDLKNKKIGLEIGLLEHLLVLSALEKNEMKESDVIIVNIPTDKTPLALESGKVDAIAAWQPSAGEALKNVPASKPIFTSADTKGLIYDLLFVSDESLKIHSEKWKKVVKVWFKIVDYIKNPANKDEILKILSQRANMTPQEYDTILKGIFIMDIPANKRAYIKKDSLNSIFGSCKNANNFNVKYKIYKDYQDIDSYIYPDFINSLQ